MNRREFFLASAVAGSAGIGLPGSGMPSPGAQDTTEPTPVLEVPVLGLRLRLHFSVDALVTEWRPIQQQSDFSTFVGGPFRVTARPKPLVADVVTVEVEIQREDSGSFGITSARPGMALSHPWFHPSSKSSMRFP